MAQAKQDMGTGNIKKLMLQLMIPAVVAQVVNLLYNIVDRIYIGNIPGIGATALTGVGVAFPILMVISAFAAFAGMGGAPLASIRLGAGDKKGAERILGNSFCFLLIISLVLTVGFQVFKRPLLYAFGASDNLIGYATDYITIYLWGTVSVQLALGLNTFISAQGRSTTAMLSVAIGAVLNLLLDPLFIFVFGMGVKGAAVATIISQTVSACMVTALLVKEKGPLHLDLGHLGFHAGALGQILRIGLPAGLQSTVFSLSNVVIQSAINSFGSTVVAGNSAASNLEGFIYTGMNAFAQAAVTFTSQNVGARRYDNLDRVMRNCLLCVTVAGLFLGCGAYFGGEVLLHFYSTDEAVVAAGLSRMQIICTAYFLCGIMDTLASCLRGRGYSVIPMIVSLVGSCLLRLVWIATIFQLNRTPFMLYISYPISWALTALVHLACLLVVRRHLRQKQQTV